MIRVLRRYAFLVKNFRSLRRRGEGLLVYGKVTCIGRKLYLGDFVSLNEGIFLNAVGSLRIGNHCTVSLFTQIHTGKLTADRYYQERTHIIKPVCLEDCAWICAGVTVAPGVTVGEGSIVAAGSMVLRDMPKFELWGGVPTQKIRFLE